MRFTAIAILSLLAVPAIADSPVGRSVPSTIPHVANQPTDSEMRARAAACDAAFKEILATSGKARREARSRHRGLDCNAASRPSGDEAMKAARLDCNFLRHGMNQGWVREDQRERLRADHARMCR